MKPDRNPPAKTEKATTRGNVRINKERCKGCGFCVEFCPRNVLKMSNELNYKGYLLPLVEDSDKCHACDYCEIICPEFAIKVTRATNTPDN